MQVTCAQWACHQTAKTAANLTLFSSYSSIQHSVYPAQTMYPAQQPLSAVSPPISTLERHSLRRNFLEIKCIYIWKILWSNLLICFQSCKKLSSKHANSNSFVSDCFHDVEELQHQFRLPWTFCFVLVALRFSYHCRCKLHVPNERATKLQKQLATSHSWILFINAAQCLPSTNHVPCPTTLFRSVITNGNIGIAISQEELPGTESVSPSESSSETTSSFVFSPARNCTQSMLIATALFLTSSMTLKNSSTYCSCH